MRVDISGTEHRATVSQDIVISCMQNWKSNTKHELAKNLLIIYMYMNCWTTWRILKIGCSRFWARSDSCAVITNYSLSHWILTFRRWKWVILGKWQLQLVHTSFPNGLSEKKNTSQENDKQQEVWCKNLLLAYRKSSK